jgi:hypothetical protein
MEERASAVWTRSNDTEEVMSTQAEPVGRKSMPPYAPPVVVIGDVETTATIQLEKLVDEER